MVDGTIYQVKADGRVYTPDLDNRTPFATVCHFHPEETWTLSEPTNLEALENAINEKAANGNVFCAVRVEGSFSFMRTHACRCKASRIRRRRKWYEPACGLK